MLRSNIKKRIINIFSRTMFFGMCFLLLFFTQANAQNYDILIKGGRVIDAKNNINGIMDVAILQGLIARVGSNIPENQAKIIINAKGLIVAPGLIDIHAHTFFGTEPNAYLSNSFGSLPPDGFTFRSGVTTVVDAGGAGWKNFNVFKEQIIDRSKTRVLSFLNIVGSGMKGGQIEQNLDDMNPELTAMVAKNYPGIIVGIKLAHFNGYNWTPVDKVVEAGRLGSIPVMIDFGGSKPPLSLEKLLIEKLGAGDIFTHTYAKLENRMPIVDDQDKVKSYVILAQKKGVIFDVGHGGGSFSFDQAIPAVNEGFYPNSISTDLHTGSMNGGMKNMTNIMSKFLNMNMSLEEVIKCSTWDPAKIINRTDLGHLTVGAVADLTILKLRKGNFGFVDTKNFRINADQKLECELTIREGKIVWDLNGISMPLWDK